MKKLISKIMLCFLIVPCLFAFAGCKATPLSENEKIEAFNALKTMLTSEIENFKNPTRTSAIEYRDFISIRAEEINFSQSGLNEEQKQIVREMQETEKGEAENLKFYGVKINEDQSRIGYIAVRKEVDGNEGIFPTIINEGEFLNQYNKFNNIKMLEDILECEDYQAFRVKYVAGLGVDVEDYDNIITNVNFTKSNDVFTFNVVLEAKNPIASVRYELIVKFTASSLISYETKYLGKGFIESKVNEMDEFQDLGFEDDKIIKATVVGEVENVVIFGKDFIENFVSTS